MGAATLTRFYAGHFILPFVLRVLVLIHLILLHAKGSSNPLGVCSHLFRVPFHPYYTVKDSLGFLVTVGVLIRLRCFTPYLLSDPENFIPANSLVTPAHIKPE